MDEIKKLINKKLNRLGIRKRINEIAVCKNVEDFLKNYLKNVHPQEINLFNRILMIKVANALEANELKFFEEELKFFLAQKGYQINKIKIIF
ncbi:MAG: hypothetical protein N2692_02755 [Patescibacteria group bacterium]|jgi:hypothetical protein|nr:hypothetical protein [Patescibacteria group bacterium]